MALLFDPVLVFGMIGVGPIGGVDFNWFGEGDQSRILGSNLGLQMRFGRLKQKIPKYGRTVGLSPGGRASGIYRKALHA